MSLVYEAVSRAMDRARLEAASKAAENLCESGRLFVRDGPREFGAKRVGKSAAQLARVRSLNERAVEAWERAVVPAFEGAL